MNYSTTAKSMFPNLNNITSIFFFEKVIRVTPTSKTQSTYARLNFYRQQLTPSID